MEWFIAKKRWNTLLAIVTLSSMERVTKHIRSITNKK
jgi:hypothetical protein